MRIVFEKAPSSRHITLFGDVSNVKETILAENKLTFETYFKTKTHVSISVVANTNTFKVNEHSEYSKEHDLRFVTKTGYSYFSGRQTVDNYFVFNKKQNKEVLRNHIESLTEGILKDFHIDTIIDKHNFNVIVWVSDNNLVDVK